MLTPEDIRREALKKIPLGQGTWPDSATTIRWCQKALIEAQRQTGYYVRRDTITFPANSDTYTLVAGADDYLDLIQFAETQNSDSDEQEIRDFKRIREIRAADLGTTTILDNDTSRTFALRKDKKTGTAYIETSQQFTAEVTLTIAWLTVPVLEAGNMNQAIHFPSEPLEWYFAELAAQEKKPERMDYMHTRFLAACRTIRAVDKLQPHSQVGRNVGFLAQQAAGGSRRWSGTSN